MNFTIKKKWIEKIIKITKEICINNDRNDRNLLFIILIAEKLMENEIKKLS